MFSDADFCGDAKQSDYVNIYFLCWALCVLMNILRKKFFGCSCPLKLLFSMVNFKLLEFYIYKQ